MSPPQIEVMEDGLGNITGYWDHSRSQWTSKEAYDNYVASLEPLDEEDEQDPPAADADDAGEPGDPDMDLPELSTLTNDQLRNILEERGTPYHKSDTKAELIKLIVESNT